MKISRIINGEEHSIVSLLDNQYLVTIGKNEKVFNNFFDAKYVFDNGFNKEELNDTKEENKQKTSGKENSRKRGKKGSRRVQPTSSSTDREISAEDFSTES